MADSIREQIIDSVKTTLEGIDGTGSYTETATTVQRFEQSYDANGDMNVDAYGLANLPTIIINAFGSEKIGGSANRTRRKMMALFSVWLFHDKVADARTTDAILNSWAKDIEIALMADHTQGALCHSTEVLMDQQIFDLEQFPDYVGVGVLVEFIYQHKRGDPTTP